MKHFIMKEHSQFQDSIHLSDSKENICQEWICFEKFHKVPMYSVLTVTFNLDLPLPDIFTTPFFMVSEMIYKVIKMYGEEVYDRNVVLINSEKNMQKHYHLLLINDADNRNYLLKSGCLFYLKIKEKRELVVNLDFAESILRRGAIGISLEELIL